ncbi:MAG: V-type ATP synthase subunit K [Candidatus Omnitrophica bacterium]|nr:V-type ATP synthase subunit K [Candidatus Omnitrophota bacterium]
MIQGFGDMSLSLAFAAVGSALGTGVAGMAAVGAWKKAFSQNKTAPFILLAFVGAPLTQTIYGWILQDQIIGANLPANTYLFQAVLGLAAGIAMGASAYMQGKAAARACDALAETGKGFGQYITVLGIIETVALFVMVFCMRALPSA